MKTKAFTILLFLFSFLPVIGQNDTVATFYFSSQVTYTQAFGMTYKSPHALTNWLIEEGLQGNKNLELGILADVPFRYPFFAEFGIKILTRSFYINYHMGEEIVYYSEGIQDSVFINSCYEGRLWTDRYISLPVRIGINLHKTKHTLISLRIGSALEYRYRTNFRAQIDNISMTLNTRSALDYKYEIPVNVGVRFNLIFEEIAGFSIEPQFGLTLQNRQAITQCRAYYLSYGLNLCFFFKPQAL